MKKIGITGQAGFVGNHLYNTLSLDEKVTLIPFERAFFSDKEKLENFVASCDVIVHLAAMNRHEDANVIYTTNTALVDDLLTACKNKNVTPHILFSSSSQETKENLYGKSKKEGKEKFINWANNTNGKFTSLTIPNVFGPFGRPNYNSVVATFCHKVANGEEPTIINDSDVNLIYVNELIAIIIQAITGKAENTINIGKNASEVAIAAPHTKKVSKILDLLKQYKKDYMENGIFPSLEETFEKALFNTFRCYVPTDHYPVKYTKHTDPRGSFVEIARTQTSGQFSFSTTVPGITRGNHFHTRKAERFAVISGKALIQLRKIGTDEVIDYYLDGKEPAYVDMPIWYTHNIKNIGEEELITLFWINEPYNQEDADTYFVNV
ncbi:MULTISPECIES: polysaccharide biosynthesis C-terminal domain-containing protein [unclassified Cellulophaga]|uniref:polysaccharide biosynthesis C-terminal domain-containing protein n=1 Tax=unclassified Cellulophaga TaxID=2634405 RepID=UPI0026E1A2AC|nr:MULTISPECIES: NAD-dependent epimerase/dehydratase family protein [unclassified Cellulophaga]MDO6491476.1 NAD-dependent epimerase/dehydratase family protein [Cellulophaga sp. 2_MG-2023]MDO6493353.1 NAD-dependent epimerase/dehydratase family protein [Cellulophaga sp. 3_MG-2023]